MKTAAEKFGGIDILVNNASAINLAGSDGSLARIIADHWIDTETCEMKRFDLMHQINARGTYLCTQAAIPYLKKVISLGSLVVAHHACLHSPKTPMS